MLLPSYAFAGTGDDAMKIEIDPGSATLSRGGHTKFGVYVDAPRSESKAVVWSLEGASDSVLDPYGDLYVGAQETSATFRVYATSVSRPAEFACATVTVRDPYVAPPAVTGVTLTPNAVSVEKGTYQQFTVEVAGTGSYDDSVSWSYTGKTSPRTYMTGSGLFVADDEASSQFTLYATSMQNPSIKGSATITVTGPPPPGTGTVTGITLGPERAQISRLTQSQMQFAAAVAGTGDYDRSVTWGVHSKLITNSSSTISQAGLLTVPVSERSEVLYVTATSKQNPSVRAETLVTVTNTSAPTQIQSIVPRTPNITLERGKSTFLRVDIYGTNGYHSEGPYGTLAWHLEPYSSKTAPTSTIDGYGEIRIAADEPNQKLAVYATSTLDPSVRSINIYITVTGAAPGSAVTGVRITKPQFTNVVYVEKGKAYDFEALVEGAGYPSQAVSWGLLSTAASYFSGNTIHISNAEAATQLDVIVHSVQDPGKFAVARLIVGTPPPIIIDSISITNESDPSLGTAWIRTGGTRQYKATVKGSYGLEPVPQDVIWNVLDNTDSNTTIDGNGFLKVGANETANCLYIHAQSIHQPFSWGTVGTASVYPRKAINAATALGITPASASLIPGVQKTFSAAVSGEAADPAWFNWSLSAGAYATVDAYGAVTVGANQPIGSTLTVRATSKDYPQKYAESTITVIGGVQSRAPASSAKQTGWVTVDGQARYFDPANGGIAPQGWFQHSNGQTYYFWYGGEGIFATGLQTIGGKQYYFNEQGHKAVGWQAIDGQARYFDPANDGAAPQGWFQHSNGQTYYFWYSGKGAFATGLQTIGGKAYGFNEQGHKAVGWQVIDGQARYFDPANDGAAPQGWFKHSNGQTYYFWWTGKGAFATGLQEIGGKQYYFNDAGHLLQNTAVIDEK
ncbi:MAG: Ig-like domain-containing protein [Clostridiales Family XIII bacterium]|nr:Ig-like domain-containing protein [Clostridiales Family XIII bacterium]